MRRLAIEIETAINRLCIEEYQSARWNENNISYRLVQELTSLLDGRGVEYEHFQKVISFKSYKQDGNVETKYGDIALLVNIQFSSGETLKGVAFLEAKRLFNSGYFESMDLTQLQRIEANAPYSQVLQYYPSPTSFILKYPFTPNFKSSMWVAPVNTARQLLSQITQSVNHRIIRISFPLSQFITGRILWGKDLDYRTDIYNEVLKAVEGKINPQYLCVLDTYYPDQQPLETLVSEKWKTIG